MIQHLLTYDSRTVVLDQNSHDDESNLLTVVLETLALPPSLCVTLKSNGRLVFPNTTMGDLSDASRTIHVTLPILGGKGGFGALLKAQSKKSGVKQTTNFGACRDLNGRRLRHVNDEVKLARWRDREDRKRRGLNVDEIKEAKTGSGIENWHLAVPTWADSISNKFKNKNESALKAKVKFEERRAEEIKRRAEEEAEKERKRLDTYVSFGGADEATMKGAMEKSVREGLRKGKEKKKKKREGMNAQFAGITDLSPSGSSFSATPEGPIAAAAEQADKTFNMLFRITIILTV